MQQVTINGKKYHFKPSNYALGVTLKRCGESLETVEKALRNIEFLYEYIYQTVKFSYAVLDKKFEYTNKFQFFAELDSDQDCIADCLEIITNSFDPKEEEVKGKAVAKKKVAKA